MNFNYFSAATSRLVATGTLANFPGLSSFCRYSSRPSHKGTTHHKKTYYNKQKKNTDIRVTPNAGIRHQLNTLELADKGAAEDFEQFEDQSELDIFKADKLYDRHVREEDLKKERLRHQIVKQKYFAEDRQPSVLTWAEKEHVRYLHSIDAEVHNPQALAESFGTSVEVIKKILKAKWLPENSRRIEKHDLSIQKNRKELGLPAPSIALPLPQNTSATEVALRDNPGKSYQRSFETVEENRRTNHDPLNDTMLEGPIRNHKRLSFSEFRKLSGLPTEKKSKGQEERHENETQKNSSRQEDLKILQYVQGSSEKTKWTNNDESVTINFDSPRDSEEITAYFYDSRYGYQHPYGRSVNIEEKVDVKGANRIKSGLYRRGDCFYDADGAFLYRVPELFAKK